MKTESEKKESEKKESEKKELTSKTLRKRLEKKQSAGFELLKTNRKIRKVLTEQLSKKSLTLPQLISETKLAGPEVVWHIMSMKKYGFVVEDEVAGSYVSYKLKN